MDHLPLPSTPILGFIRVPFMITEPYDNGDFLDYPSRHGWSIRGIPGKVCITLNGHDASVAQVGGLLQTWACLGLASAFMDQKVEMESLQGKDHKNRAYFSVKALGDQVADWSKAFVKQDVCACRDKLERWRDERYNYIQAVKHVAVQIQPTPKYRGLNLLFVSLAAVGEFLVQVIKDICFNSNIKQPMRITWRIPPKADCGEPIIDVMHQAGWCRNKIAKLEASTVMPIGKLWYLAHIAPPNTKDHSRCEVTQCQYLHVERCTYQLAHMESDCDCQPCGPDQDRVIDVLNQDYIPVLDIPSNSSGAELDFQVERELPEIPYVAISHVWADGHGNPHENKTPKCFLSFIKSLLLSLPGTPTRFWIDTLCVPLKPYAMRRKAITLLRDTYQRAAIVLVLDSLLMSLDSAHMDAIEIVARITCCGWAERLWTFQEGRLGRRVFFQFRDRVVEPYEAIDYTWRMSFSRIPSIPSHLVHLAFISHYTATSLLHSSIMKGLLTSITMVRQSLCTRSTSIETDEAICLANTMGLDVGRVYDTPGPDRMEAFWSQVTELPAWLAFSTAKRKLSGRGFRWAPASLMGDLGNVLWSGPDTCNQDSLARATSSGLVVKFPSFAISTVANARFDRRSALKRIMDKVQVTDAALHFVGADGVYYNCIVDGAWHSDMYEPEESDHFSVLIARHPVALRLEGVPDHEYNPDWMEEGIFVSCRPSTGNSEPLPAKGLCHIRLIKVGSAYQTLFAEFRLHAERFLQSEGWKYNTADHCQFTADVASFVRKGAHAGKLIERFGRFERFQPSEEDFFNGVASLAWQWPFWNITVPAEDVTWCLD
ncbi:hypothetical protein F4805DRAFT_100719 [Annulohypoxylon moriforme]|nr:hypothetical protein F4805DRAFT_100719 [Annulohypoxylon moriforme]